MADIAPVLQTLLTKDDSSEPPAKKRKFLRHYDLLPAQLLNPMGRSNYDNASLQKLWDWMKKGNKAAAYSSELCDEDHERQVVGISRFCQVLDAAIQTFLDSKSLKAILHDKVYQKTREEASTMQPYLQKLILTNYEHRVRSIRGIAYEKNVPAKELPSPSELLAAYDKVVHFVKHAETSILLATLRVLSEGGIWYTAHVQFMGMASYVANAAATSQQLEKAATKRMSTMADLHSSSGGSQSGYDFDAFLSQGD